MRAKREFESFPCSLVTSRDAVADSFSSSSVPGSPASLGSDAMDESDSEAEGAGPDVLATSDQLYPYDGLYQNAADKEYVEGLNQLDREQLLGARAEEIQQKQREMQLKNLISSNTVDKTKKRKAAAELEEERGPRQKTRREKLLDSYKSVREQAKEGGRTRPTARGRSRSQSEASFDRDASGSPDARPAPTAASKENDLPIEMEHIERVRVGRTRLAQNCFNPGFEKAMIGCFARVCIGQNQDRQNEYRMTVIKDIVTGPPYLVDASPVVPKFYTDQYVMVAHGKAQKQWPFNNCSDSKFTERELNRWKQQMATDTVRMITRGDAEKTCTGIHELLNHHLNSQEINEKVAKREKYRHLFAEVAAPVKKTNTDDAAERLRKRNEAIRKADAEERRKTFAQQVRKKNQAMRQIAAAKAAAKTNGSSGESLAVPKNEIDALFSEGSDVSRPASPAPAVGSGTATPQKHKSGRFTKMTMDDDVIGSMDLAIDIDI